jgi:catechol 2,3-dioxygenase-like lactoylglutathione lyase family enzyme
MRVGSTGHGAAAARRRYEDLDERTSDRKASGKGHYAFRVEHREEVDAFHAAALAAGGKDNGPPGLRPDYGPRYYAAFVKDGEGNNIEVVCYARGKLRKRRASR